MWKARLPYVLSVRPSRGSWGPAQAPSHAAGGRCQPGMDEPGGAGGLDGGRTPLPRWAHREVVGG